MKAIHITLIVFLSALASSAYAAATGEQAGELEDPVKLLAYMAAGIGIFLVGVKYIGGHLQQLSLIHI